MGKQAGAVQEIKILFAAANPADQARLQLDQEIREIQQKILLSEHRYALNVQQIWATRADDLLQYLNMHKPHIVHFSGHGSASGEIILLDSQQQSKPVSPQALQALFTTLKDNVRIVLLNACFSKVQAEAISGVIDCTIGMNKAMSGPAARTFAASFYRALGFGRSVQEAFEQGKLALQLEGISEHLTPELLHRSSIHPAQIYLLSPADQSATQASKGIAEIERTLRRRDYDTAYHMLDTLLHEAANRLAPHDLARLRYLEMLTHLEGQRPCMKSPTVMAQVERLMQLANQAHRCHAYLSILAIVQFEIARAGLRVKDHQQEARRLLHAAQKLPRTNDDTHALKLFAHDQPRVYQEYRSHLIQASASQDTRQKTEGNRHGNNHR